MLFGVAQVKGIHDHTDIGRVFAADLGLRDVNQLDALTMELPHVAFVMTPVAVGAFVDHSPFLQQPRKYQAHVERGVAGLLHAQGQVFKINEYSHQRLLGHNDMPSGWKRASEWREYRT